MKIFAILTKSNALPEFGMSLACFVCGIWVPFIVGGLMPVGYVVRWYGIPTIITLLVFFIVATIAGFVYGDIGFRSLKKYKHENDS